MPLYGCGSPTYQSREQQQPLLARNVSFGLPETKESMHKDLFVKKEIN
jgi:hypothetical protein